MLPNQINDPNLATIKPKLLAAYLGLSPNDFAYHNFDGSDVFEPEDTGDYFCVLHKNERFDKLSEELFYALTNSNTLERVTNILDISDSELNNLIKNAMEESQETLPTSFHTHMDICKPTNTHTHMAICEIIESKYKNGFKDFVKAYASIYGYDDIAARGGEIVLSDEYFAYEVY